MRRTLLCLLTSGGLLLMAACGGDSPTSTTPPTTQPPPPPAPELVLGGSFDLPVDFVTGGYFTAERAGNIVATVDYTYATSQILVWIARGQCTFEQFVADSCTYAATSFEGGDPRVVSVAGATAGNYTLIVYNGGPADEAFSVQVVLTPSAASASGAAANAAPVRGTWRGRRPLHR